MLSIFGTPIFFNEKRGLDQRWQGEPKTGNLRRCSRGWHRWGCGRYPKIKKKTQHSLQGGLEQWTSSIVVLPFSPMMIQYESALFSCKTFVFGRRRIQLREVAIRERGSYKHSKIVCFMFFVPSPIAEAFSTGIDVPIQKRRINELWFENGTLPENRITADLSPKILYNTVSGIALCGLVFIASFRVTVTVACDILLKTFWTFTCSAILYVALQSWKTRPI